MSKSNKSLVKVEIIILSFLLLIEILSGLLYLKLHNRICFHIFAVFLILLYHFLVRAITPRILELIHKDKKFNSDNLWFRQKAIEKRIYKILQVKKWKDSLPTIKSEEFSLRTNSFDGVIEIMCIAEVLHIQIFFWSLLFILFGFVFGYFWIFIIVGIFSACWETRFIMAQRYNRPRVKALMLKRK